MISLSTNTTNISVCASMDFPQPSQARPRLPEIYKYKCNTLSNDYSKSFEWSASNLEPNTCLSRFESRFKMSKLVTVLAD